MQLTRRNLLAGAGAAIAGAARATVPSFAAWEPSLRYPDPAVKILDQSKLREISYWQRRR
jgi:gluconolactonase